MTRTVRTFLLRVLVDADEPGILRGTIRPIPEGEARPFASEQALWAALCQMALPAADAAEGAGQPPSPLSQRESRR